jgi:hypothetical protein
VSWNQQTQGDFWKPILDQKHFKKNINDYKTDVFCSGSNSKEILRFIKEFNSDLGTVFEVEIDQTV